MKILRSHILRVTVITLLVSGFGLCFLQPAQSGGNSQSFARWLGAMADQSGTADMKEELDRLEQSGLQFSRMIEKASRIVSENNGKFNIAFQKAAASGRIYHLLLFEWDQFKTENRMADVPVRSLVKPLLPFSTEKSGGFLFKAWDARKFVVEMFPVRQFEPERIVSSLSLIPMAGGIAIGAP